MSAKSKQQYKFMKAVASGAIKAPGLSKEEAEEYTRHNLGSKRFGKLVDKVRGKNKNK